MSFYNFLILIIFLFNPIQASLNWLSIAKQTNLENLKQCNKLSGWTAGQKEFCKQNPIFTYIFRNAAKLTLDECQYQFKSRRWNCSTDKIPRLFNKLPESGYREASFIYALSSAALTYSITSACTEGKLPGCSCLGTNRVSTPNGYQWTGCSDNIAYAMGIADKFLDPRIRNKPNLTIVNLHNFETGRQIIESNMVKQCKCHGVSGSCEIKTCWRSMPSFNQIGNKLKEKYDSATQIELRKNQNKLRISPVNKESKRLSKSDLIFLNKSPDYCLPNSKLAFYGTKDRICNKTSRGIDSCYLLCCGRSSYTTLEVVTYKCNCTFKWCCSVNCQECSKISKVTRCR